MSTPNALNRLKTQIINLLEKGWTPSSIAELVGVSIKSVEHIARCEAGKDQVAGESSNPTCTVGHLIEVLQQFVAEGISPDAEVLLMTTAFDYRIALIEAMPGGRIVNLHSAEEE